MSLSLEQQAQAFVRDLIKAIPDEAKEYWARENQYLKYQGDPIGFGENVLLERYTEDMKKIMTSFVENKITVCISATSTGKTFSSATLAIYAYKCYPNSKVITTAAPPLENLKTLLWGELGSRIRKHDSLFSNDSLTSMLICPKSENETKKGEPNHFIKGFAIPTTGTPEQRVSKFSGRHAPQLFFIVDEGDAVPDEVYEGIDGCMSGGYTRLLIMFNPKLQSGYVYRLIQDGLANVVHLTAFNHPNVISGMDLIPGAVTRDITLERINEQTVPVFEDEVIDGDCFLVPDFLVGATCLKPGKANEKYLPLKAGWRRIKKHDFHYKVLGRYPSAGSDQLISREAIERCITRWNLFTAKNGEKPPDGIKPILGADVGDVGDPSVVCCRYGGFVDRFKHVFYNTDPDEFGDKLIPLSRSLSAQLTNVDSIGVGAGVAPKLKRAGIKSNRTMVSEKAVKTSNEEKKMKIKFRRLRDAVWWNTKEFIEKDDTAMLPPDRELIDELLVATYCEDDNGYIVIMPKKEMKKRLGRSPNKADALTLTFVPKKERPRAALLN